MMKITICPTCGSDEIKRLRRRWTGKVEGKTYTVPALEHHECPHCGEKVYDREAIRKIDAYSPTYSREQETKTA